MGILKRMRDITAATVNEVLDKVEDPIAMLNQYLRDMETEIRKGEFAISREHVTEKKWLDSITEVKERIEKRTRQARLAVDNGDDAIAKKALADKLYSESKLEEYELHYQKSKEQVMLIGTQLSELKEKYTELRNKKMTLVSRANVTKSVKEMNRVMMSLDTDSATKGFARIEEKISMLEAESKATQNMKSFYGGINIPNVNDEKIENELAKLKAGKKQLGAEKDIVNHK